MNTPSTINSARTVDSRNGSASSVSSQSSYGADTPNTSASFRTMNTNSRSREGSRTREASRTREQKPREPRQRDQTPREPRARDQAPPREPAPRDLAPMPRSVLKPPMTAPMPSLDTQRIMNQKFPLPPQQVPVICIGRARDVALNLERRLAPHFKFCAIIDLPNYSTQTLQILLHALNPRPTGLLVGGGVPVDIQIEIEDLVRDFHMEGRYRPKLVIVPEDIKQLVGPAGFVKWVKDELNKEFVIERPLPLTPGAELLRNMAMRGKF